MPTISVYLEQLNDATTEGRIRTHSVLIDRPHEKGGNDQGAMGGELLLISLGGCFNSTLLATIKARNIAINDITIQVNGKLEGTPPHYTAIEMVVKSEYEEREEFAKLVTMAERACIVANTLKNAVKLTVRTG